MRGHPQPPATLFPCARCRAGREGLRAVSRENMSFRWNSELAGKLHLLRPKSLPGVSLSPSEKRREGELANGTTTNPFEIFYMRGKGLHNSHTYIRAHTHTGSKAKHLVISQTGRARLGRPEGGLRGQAAGGGAERGPPSPGGVADPGRPPSTCLEPGLKRTSSNSSQHFG